MRFRLRYRDFARIASWLPLLLGIALALTSCAATQRNRSDSALTWQLIGPFSCKGEEGLSIDYLHGEAEFAGTPQRDSTGVRASDGYVDLNEELGPGEYAVAYAYTEFNSPQAGVRLISAGSDDGIKILLNGKTVHSNRVFRAAWADQDVLTAPVQKGTNRLLVKIEQGTGGWGFFLRLSDTVAPTTSPNLVAIDPLDAPEILLGSELPLQQTLEVTVANFGDASAIDA